MPSFAVWSSLEKGHAGLILSEGYSAQHSVHCRVENGVVQDRGARSPAVLRDSVPKCSKSGSPGPAHDEGSLAGEGPSAVGAIEPDATVAVAEDRSGIVVRMQGYRPGDRPGLRTEGGVFTEQFAAVVGTQP